MNTKDMFFHNNPTIAELPAQTVCETLAASLLYPVVIISRDGFIVYKNDSMKKSECRWRIGASLKYYIGNTLAENVLSTKQGDYKAFNVDEKSVAALRLDDYFFLVFLPYLHMNEAHISVLYRYMTSIPEKEFFDIHSLSAPETFSETENKKWNSFKKKYQNFYQKRYPYLEETHKLYVKETSESRHELYDILRTLAKVVNNRKHLIGCEILFKQQNIWDDFWFKCRSEDMGVLMSMVLYLCMMFSDSSRTKIEINMERFSFEDISRVSFSFKNGMSEKEVEKIFLSGSFSDERVIYYYTVKCLAFKYFWGFDVKKNDDRLEFSLILHKKPTENGWFFDSKPVTSDFVIHSFMDFVSMLIEKDLKTLDD